MSCSICRENFRKRDCLYSTTCGHVYHFVCMQQWQSRSSSCPECRAYKPETHKLYLELNDSNDYKEEMANLQTLLSECREKVKRLENELMKTFNGSEMVGIKETLANTLNCGASLEMNLNNADKQITTLKKQCNDYDKKIVTLMNEKQQLKDELSRLKSDDYKLINGSQSHNDNDNLPAWLIKLNAKGKFQIKGPFQSVTEGIIEAKRELLRETCITIEGADMNYSNNWLEYIRKLGLMTVFPDSTDIIKNFVKGNKLMVQFKTAEMRDLYFQNGKHLYINGYNERFSNEIIDIYDSPFQYAKILKEFGYKAVYRKLDYISVKRSKYEPPVRIYNHDQVDDLIKQELRLRKSN
uniref:RING-type domain-containing protein n=1 Tax=Glossina brevipalpis TaxID=37001 RepID=A0A1A9X5L3_9MUSC